MTNITTSHFWSHLAHLRENSFRAMMTAFYASIIFCLIMLIFTDQVNKHRTTPLPQQATSSTSQATTSIISPSPATHTATLSVHNNRSFVYNYAYSRKLHPVLTWSIAALILLAFILANILTNWKRTRQILWLFLPLIALLAITKTLAACYIRLL